MELKAIGDLSASIQDMGQMLKQMTSAKLELDDKMLKAAGAEQEQAAQTNSAIDTFA
jgi:hypothetical protein